MFDFEISGIHLEEKLVRQSIAQQKQALLVSTVTLNYTTHMSHLVSNLVPISKLKLGSVLHGQHCKPKTHIVTVISVRYIVHIIMYECALQLNLYCVLRVLQYN